MIESPLTGEKITIIDLHEQGIISYLHKKGIVSASILSYITYYIKFQSHRNSGKSYRDAVRLLSAEFKVSETTIKKGIKLIQETFK
jgi:hypothetical protein